MHDPDSEDYRWPAEFLYEAAVGGRALLRVIADKHGLSSPIGIGLNPEPCSAQEQAAKADEEGDRDDAGA